jgi:hypothetical protein
VPYSLCYDIHSSVFTGFFVRKRNTAGFYTFVITNCGCEILGFRCDLPEFCCLLGHYAALVDLTPTFRDYVSYQFSGVKMSKNEARGTKTRDYVPSSGPPHRTNLSGHFRTF